MKPAALLLLMLSIACDGTHEVGNQGLPFTPSNGLRLYPGTDASKVTTLSGNCLIDPDFGQIVCSGLVLRLDTPGVWGGLGWEKIDPVAPNCNGTSVAPEPISVFSFGTLEVVDGTRINSPRLYPPRALSIAFLAAHRILLHGFVDASGGGSYGFDLPGPARGADSMAQTTVG